MQYIYIFNINIYICLGWGYLTLMTPGSHLVPRDGKSSSEGLKLKDTSAAFWCVLEGCLAKY